MIKTIFGSDQQRQQNNFILQALIKKLHRGWGTNKFLTSKIGLMLSTKKLSIK